MIAAFLKCLLPEMVAGNHLEWSSFTLCKKKTEFNLYIHLHHLPLNKHCHYYPYMLLHHTHLNLVFTALVDTSGQTYDFSIRSQKCIVTVKIWHLHYLCYIRTGMSDQAILVGVLTVKSKKKKKTLWNYSRTKSGRLISWAHEYATT